MAPHAHHSTGVTVYAATAEADHQRGHHHQHPFAELVLAHIDRDGGLRFVPASARRAQRVGQLEFGVRRRLQARRIGHVLVLVVGAVGFGFVLRLRFVGVFGDGLLVDRLVEIQCQFIGLALDAFGSPGARGHADG